MEELAVGEEDQRVLVSLRDNEDAVVVKVPPGKALVQTLDFFTPIVNDPLRFGEIAAANSLSDVYAMGGEPYTVMNIVCFPSKTMDISILKDILKGGFKKIKEAGAILAGGHSVDDDEIKYGLSVTGLISPENIAQNTGFSPYDVLLLTKPIGTGILATAIKARWDGWEIMEDELYRWASRLNKGAGEVIYRGGIKGATDITGFGLAGHLLEVARASRVEIEIWSKKVPLMGGVYDLAAMGLVPEGSHLNKNFCSRVLKIGKGVDNILVDILFDAQTSGGLVLSVAEDRVEMIKKMLIELGEEAWEIGVVKPYSGHYISIV